MKIIFTIMISLFAMLFLNNNVFQLVFGQPNIIQYTSMALGKINNNTILDMVILGNTKDTSLPTQYTAFYKIAYDISPTNSTITQGVTDPIVLNSPIPGPIDGIALGNINNNTLLDMMMVGKKTADSKTFYKIAYDISPTNSQITQGVTLPIELNSARTMDIALGNINADPRLDMVILEQGERGDEIRAYYRIGYDISQTNSTITHNVTGRFPITGAYNNMSSVTDVELGNINTDPRLDMVLIGPSFWDPEWPENYQQFHEYYRIGYDISPTNSQITQGVTPPIEVKGDFGPIRNNIFSTSLGNINADPRLDMVLIGSHFNDNQYYRIGYDISPTNSTITQGVTPPIELR